MPSPRVHQAIHMPRNVPTDEAGSALLFRSFGKTHTHSFQTPRSTALMYSPPVVWPGMATSP